MIEAVVEARTGRHRKAPGAGPDSLGDRPRSRFPARFDPGLDDAAPVRALRRRQSGCLPHFFPSVELGDERLGIGLHLVLAAVAAEVERAALGGHLERLAHRAQVVRAHRADGLRDRRGLFGRRQFLDLRRVVCPTAWRLGVRLRGIGGLRPFNLRSHRRSSPWEPFPAEPAASAPRCRRAWELHCRSWEDGMGTGGFWAGAAGGGVSVSPAQPTTAPSIKNAPD